MTQEANGSYLGPKHLKQKILCYSQFIEKGQAKLGQHYHSEPFFEEILNLMIVCPNME